MRIRFIFIFFIIAVLNAEGYSLQNAQKLFVEKKYSDAQTIYSYIALNRHAIRPYMQYAAAECAFSQAQYSETLSLLCAIDVHGRKGLAADVQGLTYACFLGLGRRNEISNREKTWYGEYLFSKNRFAESLEWLQAVSPDAVTTRNLFIQGRDYLSMSAFVSADSVLRDIDSAEARYYRANVCVQRGLLVTAEQLYNSVAQGKSEFAANALHQLSRLALGQGNLTLSNDYLREIIHRFPKSNLADDASWTVGWRLYRSGTYAQAADVFLQGYMQHRTGDYSDALLFWAGKCALRLGKQDEAQLMWQKVAIQFPGRYYGARANMLVSVNALVLTDNSLSGNIPESIQQFIAEHAFSEALRDLVEISGNMRTMDILTAQRAIARSASAEGQYTVAIRTLYALFSSAEIAGRIITDRELWEMYYPQGYATEVAQMHKKYSRVSQSFIYAVMREESLFDPSIVSFAGASGLMQLMPATAKLLSVRQNSTWEPERLTQPEINIGFGVFYLNNLLIRYEDDLHVALAGYNAGPVAADQWYKRKYLDLDEWIESIDYRETRGYVKKVWRSYYWYKKLYDF